VKLEAFSAGAVSSPQLQGVAMPEKSKTEILMQQPIFALLKHLVGLALEPT
jgi:hypothetical protein